MKLKALFLGGILAIGLMSFTAKGGGSTIDPGDGGVCGQSTSTDNLGTCNGGGTPCCASPGTYLG